MGCIVGRLSMGIGGYKSGDHKDSFINTAKKNIKTVLERDPIPITLQAL